MDNCKLEEVENSVRGRELIKEGKIKTGTLYSESFQGSSIQVGTKKQFEEHLACVASRQTVCLFAVQTNSLFV